MKALKFLRYGFFLLLAALNLWGCSSESYPGDKLKESLAEICRKEYGIEDVDVKIAGSTIGVYLPLKKLFAADFKEAAVTGKVRNLETLFEPSPEALEKVEDVLFSISRVLLSTSKPFEFYVLQATDVDKTGMQLILTGYVNDIKRVRVWDISRNEYRKRVIHELKLNRSVIWHKPVRRFFRDLGELPAEKIQAKYFGSAMPIEAIQKLFFNGLGPVNPAGRAEKIKWENLDLRSALVQRNEVLVYVKAQPKQAGKPLSSELQYLFVLSLRDEEARIVRIVPFQYKDENGILQTIPFPKELQIEENLERWEQEFPLEAVDLGDFLAKQLTRRIQNITSVDERVQNTFREAKVEFEYHKEPPKPYFSLNIEAVLRDLNNYNKNSIVFHEDMIYLLNIASREFVDVVRSYQFGKYDYLRLNVAQEPEAWTLGREDLEMFRRKKVDLQGLLSIPAKI